MERACDVGVRRNAEREALLTRIFDCSFEFCLSAGAARGIRTPDPIITNDVLYQLSYCGLIRRF
jgi:hypothetical protein